jgi:hypothetical protein
VSGDETIAFPGGEYAWLIETSDDGDTWSQEHHPVHGTRASGGIEQAASPDVLAAEVLARRFRTLHSDSGYDWEELWFRATVWDHQNCVDYADWEQSPYLPEHAQASPEDYGRYLLAHHAEPHAVEVRVPRQVRDAARQATRVA